MVGRTSLIVLSSVGLSGIRVESINEEKASRILLRISLLSVVREEVREMMIGLYLVIEECNHRVILLEECND